MTWKRANLKHSGLTPHTPAFREAFIVLVLSVNLVQKRIITTAGHINLIVQNYKDTDTFALDHVQDRLVVDVPRKWRNKFRIRSGGRKLLSTHST